METNPPPPLKRADATRHEDPGKGRTPHRQRFGEAPSSSLARLLAKTVGLAGRGHFMQMDEFSAREVSPGQERLPTGHTVLSGSAARVHRSLPTGFEVPLTCVAVSL